jgi:probable HAF family extracellular repeat protein
MKTVARCLTALTLIAWSECAFAQLYSFTEIDVGFNGCLVSPPCASAVNDSGQVTGTDAGLAYIYSNGVMTEFGPFTGGAGYPASTGQGINSSGQVTGNASIAEGIYQPVHAFIYGSAGLQDLGTLGGTDTTNSYGEGINDSGQVAGYSYLNDNVTQHAFIFGNSVMQDIATLGGTDSYAYGINASGQVAGYSYLADNVTQHAFIYSNGVMQDIGTLGGTNSRAYRINTSGQVTGYSTTAGGATHAFIYSNSVMQDLGTLGGTNSYGQGINDQGQVVGYSYLADNVTQHAFIYSNGQMVDLNSLIDPRSPLATSLTAATGISNAGYITADGTGTLNGPGSQGEAFLLTLEPEVAPTVSPVITGTLGNNGWYISGTTTLAWTITGNPIPTTTGCGNVSVPQTTGTAYTCSATNSVGNANREVTIKEDSVQPSVVITTPASNATYTLKQNVLASYSCLDATSGMASCAGTVANGVSIDTSSLGTQKFTVTGRDNAGNVITITALYSIGPATAPGSSKGGGGGIDKSTIGVLIFLSLLSYKRSRMRAPRFTRSSARQTQRYQPRGLSPPRPHGDRRLSVQSHRELVALELSPNNSRARKARRRSDGPGIPAKGRQRVFDSFVQLEPIGGKKTGFGLGLEAMVLAVVKRYRMARGRCDGCTVPAGRSAHFRFRRPRSTATLASRSVKPLAADAGSISGVLAGGDVQTPGFILLPDAPQPKLCGGSNEGEKKAVQVVDIAAESPPTPPISTLVAVNV